MQPLITPPARAATSAEKEAIRMVHDVVRAWDEGVVTIDQAERDTTGPQRWIATRFTPVESAAWPRLMRFLDALIARDDTMIQTKHGAISVDDLVTGNGKLVYDDTAMMVCWPIRQPWRFKPDADGFGGERGEPEYRQPGERAGEKRVFGVDEVTRPREWWQADDADEHKNTSVISTEV